MGNRRALIFGYGMPSIDQVMTNIGVVNFESAFFTILYAYGLFSLIVFVFFLIKIVTQGRKLSILNKYINYLIVFNIVGVSLTIGGVITFYAFQFVALIYVYNIITDPRYNEVFLRKNTLFINNRIYQSNPNILSN